MGIRSLMLSKEKRELTEKLETLNVDFKELNKREAELETAIEEAETEEEKQAVSEAVDQFEADSNTLEKDKKELEERLAEIDAKLEEEEKKVQKLKDEEPKEKEERKEVVMMEQRTYFGGLTRDAFSALAKRDEVKQFLVRTRDLAQSRGVNKTELAIPEVLLGVLRENIADYSKLLTKTYLKKIKGRGRVTIIGTIPEAVWTEACANINELEIGLNSEEVDGYKVAGLISVCNATLEDVDDINLLNEVMEMLAKSIGLALDKAIVYGTGKKMPLGIVTRLAQEIQPETYSETARPWVNLSTTNIKQVTGDKPLDFYSNLILATGAMKGEYSHGGKFWVMNDTTKTILQAKALAFNASGALVSGANDTLPVIGGDVIVLPFIPDGDIIGGYDDLYLLAERGGMALAQSEHAQFIPDNTVFKGTARYDGKPAIAEGFIALNVNGGEVTKTLEFAEDKANKAEG